MPASTDAGRTDATVWARLAAPVPAHAIQWRQDGTPITRDGRHAARYVAYIEAGLVRERLDSVVPGEWSLALELLPPSGTGDDAQCAFKARLSILGVQREDVGLGRDYKAASTDAFKRAAVRFGIGHELYDMPVLWVPMNGDGKYAKPIEPPETVYARKQGAPPQTIRVGMNTQSARPVVQAPAGDPYSLTGR